MRPATGEINPGQLIALAAAVGFGVSMALVKSLTRTESALSVIFWMTVVQATAGALPTLYLWTWPSATAWAWTVVIAICGTFSHYCLASAMRHADATVVVPMDFLRVPLTATAGWLIYAERLDVFTVFGAALILTGNLLNLRATGTSPGRPWGFFADVGMVMLKPRSSVQLGATPMTPAMSDQRMYDSSSDLVDDWRLSPLIQLGISYKF